MWYLDITMVLGKIRNTVQAWNLILSKPESNAVTSQPRSTLKKQIYPYMLLLVCCYLVRAEQNCPRGHYFVPANSRQAVCPPCLDGSFMPDNDHVHQNCLSCTQVVHPDLEVLMTECNQTHDSVIFCRSGYYRYKARSAEEIDLCVMCSQCDFPARPCQGHFDAVCCRPGELCVSQDGVMFGGGGSLQSDGVKQAEGFHELLITGTENGTSCGRGFYTYKNISDNNITCRPCSQIPSLNISTNHCKHCTDQNQLPAECRTKSAVDIAQAEFRLVSILLFSVAVIIDCVYVFLYGRNFLRKYTGNASRRSCFSVSENRSRMIGTAGIDIHIFFVCVHSFGILCEVGIVNMDEGVLWRFTICVGVLTLILYCFDAVLFLFVKRLFCSHVCVSYRPEATTEPDRFQTELHVFLDNT